MVITIFYNKPLDRILDLINLNSNEHIKGKLSFKNEIEIRNLSFLIQMIVKIYQKILI